MRRAIIGLFGALLIVSCGQKVKKIIEIKEVLVEPGITHPPTGGLESPALDASIFPAPGATAFLTANNRELLSSGTANDYWAKDGRNELSGAASFDDASESPPAEDPSPEPMPEPDPSREIVEADLFKVEGDLVYALNRYRGLVIVDLSIPDQPVVRGRLPFQAVPIEMYVRDGRAYIVISDYFTYWMYDPDADPLGFHGSQILIADVSDPDNPTSMGSLHVDGEVTDTRMVGDVIYAISKRRPDYWRYNTADWEDTTWVVSLNIADPANIHEVDRLTFQGTSTLIHAAHHAIFVAATDPNYYLYDSEHDQETLVTYVDISDPDGDIDQRGHVYIPGRILDKFKMDYHDGTFRVLSQDWWYYSYGQLVVVDVSYPDQMEIISQLPIDEQVWGYMTASRFSGERAYASTRRYYSSSWHAELHIFDLSEPMFPALAGVLESGDTVNHFEVRDDNTRLLALGRSQVPVPNCNSNYYYCWESKTTLTLYDVTDAIAPTELTQVHLGEGSSYSTANYDYKALKIIDSMNLILLPLNYYNSNYQQYFMGTQLVDWLDDQLTERGWVDNIETVQRAFPVGDRIVTISTKRIQVIDATDRDQPHMTAGLDLIRNVYEIFDIQGYEIQLISDVYNGGVKFSVVPFQQEDNVPALATLELPYGYSPFCLPRGNLVHMIGWDPVAQAQVIHTADFSNPLQPTLRGELQLASDVERIYTPYGSWYYYYWNPYAGLALENRILPFTVRTLIEDESGRRDYDSKLRLIDMTDPDNPRISDAEIPMNDHPFINKVTHGNVLYSTHVEQGTASDGNSLLYHVRTYMDRIDVSDVDNPVVLPSINVPGWLVDVAYSGELLYTVDYQWDDFGRRRNSLNVLKMVAGQAALMEVLPVSDQVNRAVFREETVWLTTHKYPWWGVHADTVESRQPYTVLNRVGMNEDATMASFTSARIHGYHFNLLDVEGQLAYLGSNYPYGVLVLDVADASAPVIVNSSRTVGYISRILVHDDFIYSPLGMFGVRRMEATASLPNDS